MKNYICRALLQQTGWLEPACVRCDDQGVIVDITDAPPPDDSARINLDGFVVPGYQNAHSHAFQYAMAGMAEHLPLGAAADDFWSWRETMYGLALAVSPDHLQAIAAMLYAEMIRHGYTAVAEFHYLHHDHNGAPYDDRAEMGQRLVAAAAEAGIEITLIPIMYRKGGFGLEPSARQRRFISPTVDSYLELLESSRAAVQQYTGGRLGAGVHSLRAVESEDISRVFAEVGSELPLHLHIAEQRKEIEDAVAYLGCRPVEWVLHNLDLSERCHLVHATHCTDTEAQGIAHSGAHVVICPSTEGNLGDGFFALQQYRNAGGRWSVGTDSHVGLNPHEELRLLDYGQRLKSEKRNILCRHEGEDSGALAFTESLVGGRRAMGASQSNFFTPGQPFNAAVYDPDYPLLAAAAPDRRLATIIYASDSTALKQVIVRGATVAQNGRHKRFDTISATYGNAIADVFNS